MEFIREKTKKKPISKRRILKWIGFGAVAAALLFLVIYGIISLVEDERQNPESIETVGTTESTEEESTLAPDFNISISDYQTLQNALYSIGKEVNKSIVSISLEKEDEIWTGENLEDEWQYAGVIIREDGDYFYVLAEGRMLEENTNSRIAFVDGSSAKGTLLSVDKKTDLAVLTIEKRLVKPDTIREIMVAKSAKPDQVENGAIVIALGSPLGTNYSILSGSITSLDSKMNMIDKNFNLLTTDIITSRNGSGILVKTKGEVIGIVGQSFRGTEEMGALTAVAIGDIDNVLEHLLKAQELAYIGLGISTVTEEIAAEHSIPRGVFVKEVKTDSPAMEAGFQSGDVIMQVNGRRVFTDAEYSEKIEKLIPGTACEFKVKRQSGEGYYDVTCEVEIGSQQ